MRRLYLLPLAAALIGCRNSIEPLSLDTTDVNVAGTYGLNFAAGLPLPIVAGVTTTQEVDLVADTISIVADSTWTETSYYVLTAFTDGTQSKAQTLSSGKYTVGSGQINFTMLVGGAATFTGSVSGTTLSLLYNNARYIYSR